MPPVPCACACVFPLAVVLWEEHQAGTEKAHGTPRPSPFETEHDRVPAQVPGYLILSHVFLKLQGQLTMLESLISPWVSRKAHLGVPAC